MVCKIQFCNNTKYTLIVLYILKNIFVKEQ